MQQHTLGIRSKYSQCYSTACNASLIGPCWPRQHVVPEVEMVVLPLLLKVPICDGLTCLLHAAVQAWLVTNVTPAVPLPMPHITAGVHCVPEPRHLSLGHLA